MYGEATIIATTMKEAERLMKRVKEELLPKSSIEKIDFDQEDLDAAYHLLDRLTLLNEKARVPAAIAQVVARLELAEETLDNHMKNNTFMPTSDDKHIVMSLEGFHGRKY